MWETACDRKKAVKKLRRQFVILDVLLLPYVWRTVRRLFGISFSLFPGYAGVWYFPVFVLRVFAAAYIWPLYLTLACICYFMDDYKAGAWTGRKYSGCWHCCWSALWDCAPWKRFLVK